MKLTKRGAAAQPTIEKEQIVKINPCEISEVVLQLMSSISSARPSANLALFWNPINEAICKKNSNGESLVDFVNKNRRGLDDIDFVKNLEKCCDEIAALLENRQDSNYIQIVVAGGFSSGKSSFLNRLTKCTNLLPSGVEPVSVVKTYLYCSEKNRDIEVKGVNQKNVVVALDVNVLEALQHSKKSNVYLASILSKLFVDIPSKELNGISFIDTPGYNNSTIINDFNGKTDEDIANEALKEGDVLFWIIDSERGTIPSADIEMIRKYEKPKVIIFNKADKKGQQASRAIVETADLTLKRAGIDNIIDILAYSTLDDKIYHSLHGHATLFQLINDVRKKNDGSIKVDDLLELIDLYFIGEIVEAEEFINNLKEARKSAADNKNKYYEYYKKRQENLESNINWGKDIILDSYTDLQKVADYYIDRSSKELDEWDEFLQSVRNYNSNRWNPSDDLYELISNSFKIRARECEKHNKKLNYGYYELDARKRLFDYFQAFLEEDISKAKDWYDQEVESSNELKSKIKYWTDFKNDLETFKESFISAVKLGIQQYQRANKVTEFYNEKKEVSVFESIKNGNYNDFLLSFKNGVNINVCNAEGYNPLTYAISKGNMQMVKFLLDKNVDPSLKDKRGYNALHAAVVCQSESICELLLEENEDLIDTKTTEGEDVLALAEKYTLKEWLQSKYF